MLVTSKNVFLLKFAAINFEFIFKSIVKTCQSYVKIFCRYMLVTSKNVFLLKFAAINFEFIFKSYAISKNIFAKSKVDANFFGTKLILYHYHLKDFLCG